MGVRSFRSARSKSRRRDRCRSLSKTGVGCWFFCDRLGRVDQPPALIPVSEAHVRRHHEPPWPDHDPDCDFYRDRAEQRLITRSYRRPAVGKRLALVASLKDQEARVPRLTARSYSRSRGALATTLMHLIETAQVNVTSYRRTGRSRSWWAEAGPSVTSIRRRHPSVGGGRVPNHQGPTYGVLQCSGFTGTFGFGISSRTGKKRLELTI
jgi:hypothetical protein